MSTLHYALENGADLYVNERQKILHYRARSTKERRRKKNRDYSTYSIGNQPWNTTVVFKMRDSVPIVRDIPAFVMYYVYGASRS